MTGPRGSLCPPCLVTGPCESLHHLSPVIHPQWPLYPLSPVTEPWWSLCSRLSCVPSVPMTWPRVPLSLPLAICKVLSCPSLCSPLHNTGGKLIWKVFSSSYPHGDMLWVSPDSPIPQNQGFSFPPSVSSWLLPTLRWRQQSRRAREASPSLVPAFPPLQSTGTRREQARQLVIDLETRGKQAFPIFLSILRDTGHGDLADMLDEGCGSPMSPPVDLRPVQLELPGDRRDKSK